MVNRRQFVQMAGGLVIAFAWPRPARALTGEATSGAPDDGPPLDQLDSWLAVRGDGTVTLYSGKVELGTGVQTALSQIVAEELDVPVARVLVVQGETGRTPDQGSTTGSKTLQGAGSTIRRAAAEARRVLVAMAAGQLGVPAGSLRVAGGTLSVPGRPGKAITYGRLIGDKSFHHTVDNGVTVKSYTAYRVVGQPIPRVELPGKVTGTHRYVHNLRVPGMQHGRVIRPPTIGATLVTVDEASVGALPGAVRVVRRENFLGVVATHEHEAVAAARALRATWSRPDVRLMPVEAMYDAMRDSAIVPNMLEQLGDVDAALAAAHVTCSATYRTPFQSHGSIGPSCAVADVRDGVATVWSGTQGAYALRETLAPLLGVPVAQVHVVWMEASGCYGHNGADDAAADAALLSQAVRAPVRVQWSRQDELAWDPKGPAMLIQCAGGVDAQGKMTAWRYTVTTPTHSTRPGGDPAEFLAGQSMGHPLALGAGGGDRNARHSYEIANSHVAVRWLHTSVLRPSAMRGLGAPANVFANESFVDELGVAAGADPIEFRLRHLTDPRAIAVIERAAQLSRWQPRRSVARSAATNARAVGRGMAFAQYENSYTYVATVVDVEVDRHTGTIHVPRVWVAHDCGLIVNPDGLRNQIEGATVQTISRTLKERVTWDRASVTSVDWRTYPILTFPDVPDSIEIALIDHPEAPAWGAGEPAACTVPAAIGNAVYDATGLRLREIPFEPALQNARVSLDDHRSTTIFDSV
jgi:nicotinate dehydrogenase subunit B